MRNITTEVLVIGGGATGTGVVRDLAMRGFNTILVERRDLSYGTTGRYHGLLHSGGRYVVKDPQAAKECIEENRILRRIMPQCIEDCGGFFVVTQWDDPGYAPQFLKGCHEVGIPVEEVEIKRMLIMEPLLNPAITQCFRVPDGSADSFLASRLNAESARQYGAQILTYHEVTRLELSANKHISSVFCHDLVKDEDVQITADLVINASGAWAGKITNLAGISIQMMPGKGTMLAVNHRVVNMVINRCKLPSDGDILVPAHTVAVIGTTDIKVTEPDHISIEPWEIRLMLEEGEKLLPNFKSFRILRAWAGVRPLLQETIHTENRDITRAFALLDHAVRDGVEGILTITSGKWTTYRKMAEVTVDKACDKLGVQRPCHTQLEALPGDPEVSPPSRYHHLGARLQHVEERASYGRLICECELATDTDIKSAIVSGEAKTIDDLRRSTRLGMGPCQGGFCTLRAAGQLHHLLSKPIIESNASLRDFIQERWKGLYPVLWGQQLRQMRLNELILTNVLNIDQLPGPSSSRLKAEMYAKTTGSHPIFEQLKPEITTSETARVKHTNNRTHDGKFDVLVIGAGLSGLFTGWKAASQGTRTCVISKGWGATHTTSGCIDVLGYYTEEPSRSPVLISSPERIFPRLIREKPHHPYSIAGYENIEKALALFQELCASAGYPLHGSLSQNWLIPTAAGALRPACLIPETMLAGEANLRTPMAIVGFEQFLDFYPALIADNLNAQQHYASSVILDLPSLNSRRIVNGLVLAKLFDTAEFRIEVAAHLKSMLGSVSRVGFPAVLGISQSIEAIHHLSELLGIQVFEIPGLPPSIPGIRLHNILISAIEQAGGKVINGIQVIGAEVDHGAIVAVISEAAAREKIHQAKKYVLSTGGILGGGITTNYNGYAQEAIFNLVCKAPYPRNQWLNDDFLSQSGHPIFQAGIMTNRQFQPIDEAGSIYFQNLYTVGNLLGGCDPVWEHSKEGIDLVTGYLVGGLA